MNKSIKVKNSRLKWQWLDSQDAVIAAPDSHITKLENESIRVLEVIIQPGMEEPMHTHCWSSVMIINSSARIEYKDFKGNKKIIPRRNIDLNNPFIEWLDPEGLHSIKNIDEIPYRAIRIELKK